jgi:hypothetical protein
LTSPIYSALMHAGRLSDVDVAIYLRDEVDLFYYRLNLAENIQKALREQRVDIIVLNKATLLMCYEVIKTGLVVKESKENRVVFEMKSLQRYLDTQELRKTDVICERAS